MIKIIHCADFHFGARFDSLSDELGSYAYQCQINCLKDMVVFANNSDADAILIAGDLFHSTKVDVRLFNDVFDILSKADCGIFIVCGNHDYYFSGCCYDAFTLPQNVKLFTTNTLQKVQLNHLNVDIYGASFLSECENISFTTDIDPNRFSICLMHSDIISPSSYNHKTTAQIEKSGFDYIAFGHNHTFSEILTSGSAHYCCSGCLMGTGFDETGTKGFVFLEIEDSALKIGFHPSNKNALIFKYIDIHARDFKSTGEIISHVLGSLSPGFDRYALKVELNNRINYAICQEDIENALRHRTKYLQINNFCTQISDPWSYVNFGGLIGEFAKIVRSKYDECDNEDEKTLIFDALIAGLEALNKEI